MSSPEHAQFYDFLGPQGADMLRLDSVSSGSLPAYINGLVASQEANEQLASFLSTSALLMEPGNESPGFEFILSPTRTAFLQGCAIATRLACLGVPNIDLADLRKIDTAAVMAESSVSETVCKPIYANFVDKKARQGYDLAVGLRPLIIEWVDRLYPGPDQTISAFLGFGLGYKLLTEYLDRRDADAIKKQLESLDEGIALDWDVALQGLILNRKT